MSPNQNNRLNLNFRFQPPPHSRYGPLVRYYNEGEWELATAKRELVLIPLDAFWMPFALQWDGKSEAEVRRAATASIYRLQLQIQHIKELFDLREEDVCEVNLKEPSSAAKFPPQSPPAAPSQPPVTQAKLEEEIEDEVDPNYDGDFRDEDALLDSIM